MSIEVDIFSTNPRFPSWGEVKSQLIALLQEETDLVEQVSLRVLDSDALIHDDEKLLPESTYYLELSIPNTLGIIVSKGNDIDKKDYIEDYGHNLAEEQIADYISRWGDGEYYFEVTSQAGRGKKEGIVFAALARSLANCCDGYIIVMHSSVFSLGVGIYSSDEFAKAKPYF